jgi:hypothetical protein
MGKKASLSLTKKKVFFKDCHQVLDHRRRQEHAGEDEGHVDSGQGVGSKSGILKHEPFGQSYQTFYVHNLQIFIIS